MKRTKSFEKLPKRKPLDESQDIFKKPRLSHNKGVKSGVDNTSNVVDSKSLKKIISLLKPDEDHLLERKLVLSDETNEMSTNSVESSDDEATEDDVDSFALQSGISHSQQDLEADDDKALKCFLTGEISSLNGEESTDILEDYSDKKSQLAETLKERITSQKSELQSEMSDACPSLDGFEDLSDLPPELAEHIFLLCDLLKKFRSGRLPKTLKMLPNLSNWEGLLEMLKPTEWSAAAMAQMTRHFSAKGKVPTLHFFSTYLLPRVRDDIEYYKRLNFHLSQALMSALFRPREFFVGILIPMCKDGLTLTAATVMSGLLRRASIPVKYAAVALAQIYSMDFTVPRAVILHALLDKKYKLPLLAITNFVTYFTRMNRAEHLPLTEMNRLPVIWFQLLLTFLQLYKDSLSEEDFTELCKLCKKHTHPSITPEIRKLLVIARSSAKAKL